MLKPPPRRKDRQMRQSLFRSPPSSTFNRKSDKNWSENGDWQASVGLFYTHPLFLVLLSRNFVFPSFLALTHTHTSTHTRQQAKLISLTQLHLSFSNYSLHLQFESFCLYVYLFDFLSVSLLHCLCHSLIHYLSISLSCPLSLPFFNKANKLFTSVFIVGIAMVKTMIVIMTIITDVVVVAVVKVDIVVVILNSSIVILLLNVVNSLF